MLNTDKAWQKWGRDDPYFGVLAEDRFAAAHIHSTRDEFFASGSADVSGMLARIEHHFGPLARGRALDHGCGVGRLSLPLAGAFAEVVALDVAPAMLAEATANAELAGVTNIRFLPVPVRRGLAIIDALVDRLAPGGGFHLTVSLRTDRGGKRWLYWASANIPGVKLWQNVCAGRAWNAPAMQMNDYPLGRIVARLAARGVTETFVTTHAEPRFATCSLIGRKPA